MEVSVMKMQLGPRINGQDRQNPADLLFRHVLVQARLTKERVPRCVGNSTLDIDPC